MEVEYEYFMATLVIKQDERKKLSINLFLHLNFTFAPLLYYYKLRFFTMRYANRFFKTGSFFVYSVANLLYDSSELRIVNFFKSLGRDYGHEISGLPGMKFVPVQLTNLEIATLTSTSPDKVQQIIDDLKFSGMVKILDDKYLIKL